MDIQGFFTYGFLQVSNESKVGTWLSGFVNWDKEGRHFRLDECQPNGDEEDCFTWSEKDPQHW